jgi:hypothetical protein
MAAAAAAAANQPPDHLALYPDQQPSYQWRPPPGDAAQPAGHQLPPVQAHVLPSQQYNGAQQQQEDRRISLSEIARQLDAGPTSLLRPNDFVLLKTLGTGGKSCFWVNFWD